MKRTLAVAIFTTFLALTRPAYSCMTVTAPGYEPTNSAKLWKSWNSSDRLFYLWGFEDGGSQVVLHFLGPWDDHIKKTMQATALRYDLSQIGDVMTSLYSDPANAYISLSAMVFIARDKLDGKNAEQMLTTARQDDCDYHSISK